MQYVKQYRHGISCVNAMGGYNHKIMYLLHTVVSSYKVNDIVYLMPGLGSYVTMNMIKTGNFYDALCQALPCRYTLYSYLSAMSLIMAYSNGPCSI